MHLNTYLNTYFYALITPSLRVSPLPALLCRSGYAKERQGGLRGVKFQNILFL